MSAWKDESSRRRDEPAGEPRTWVVDVSGFRVTVTRHIDLAPDQWALSCFTLGIRFHVLKAKGVDEAKREAINVLRSRMSSVLQALAEVQP